MLSLKKCSEQDKEFIYKTTKDSMAEFFNKYLPGGWSDEKFHSGFNKDKITIFEIDGLPIGFYDIEEICNKEPYLYVRNFQIIKDKRGYGITLVRLLEKEAKKRNLNKIRGKVFVNNERALEFFKHMGYNVIKNPELYQKEASVYLEKILF